MISLIAAHDINRSIGLNGDMPWGKSLKSDLKWFQECTLNNYIVMGSNTFRSIGSALPNRINIVLTRENFISNPRLANQKYPNCHIANSVDDLFSLTECFDKEMFIIGGAEIYRQFLPYADRLYITHIDHEFEGDTFFPEYDLNDYNTVYERDDLSEKYPLRFMIYERVKTKK